MAYTKEPLGPGPWFVEAKVTRWVEKKKDGGRLVGKPGIRTRSRLELTGRIARAAGIEGGRRYAVTVPKPGWILLQAMPDTAEAIEKRRKPDAEPGRTRFKGIEDGAVPCRRCLHSAGVALEELKLTKQWRVRCVDCDLATYWVGSETEAQELWESGAVRRIGKA